jgi:hypothetical protein
VSSVFSGRNTSLDAQAHPEGADNPRFRVVCPAENNALRISGIPLRIMALSGVSFLQLNAHNPKPIAPWPCPSSGLLREMRESRRKSGQFGQDWAGHSSQLVARWRLTNCRLPQGGNSFSIYDSRCTVSMISACQACARKGADIFSSACSHRTALTVTLCGPAARPLLPSLSRHSFPATADARDTPQRSAWREKKRAGAQGTGSSRYQRRGYQCRLTARPSATAMSSPRSP